MRRYRKRRTDTLDLFRLLHRAVSVFGLEALGRTRREHDARPERRAHRTMAMATNCF